MKGHGKISKKDDETRGGGDGHKCWTLNHGEEFEKKKLLHNNVASDNGEEVVSQPWKEMSSPVQLDLRLVLGPDFHPLVNNWGFGSTFNTALQGF